MGTARRSSILDVERPLLVTALVTPFDDRGEVDHLALAAHVDHLAGAGIDALMPCGTTGEGARLTDDEVSAVIATVIAAAGDRALVLAHVGRVATGATVGLAERAIADGAAAVSAVVPYYDPLTEQQIIAHYRELIERASAVPVYAYNIPDRTGNDLSANAVATLAGAGLAGIKDSTKSFERHLEYLDVAVRCAADGHPIDVLTGSDAMVLQSLRAGATGSVSAIGNFRPDLFTDIKAALVRSDNEAADRAAAAIKEIRDSIVAGPVLRQLKQAVAECLVAAGIRYPVAVRAPG